MKRSGFMLIVLWAPSAVVAQSALPPQQFPSNFSTTLAVEPAVRDALNWLDRNFDAQVAEWIRITEIPGPSRHEQRRAAYVRAEMEKEGLRVSTDSIGNVIGVRKGTGTATPSVVFAAHLDTVHPLDTDVRVKRDGDVLRAPGIFDNSASVANLLAVMRALNRGKVQTQGDLIFIGTAQEELGLNGMEYWLQNNPRPGAVVAMDGGLGSISYGALGIYWTRYSFKGPGSHTNTSAGKPHPARALADAIRSIYEIKIPPGRGTTVYNVGMLNGGKIFNGIPEEVSFTMDLRSVNPVLLDSLNLEINRRVAEAAAAHKVTWSAQTVTRNAAGGTEEMLRDRRAHPLVQTAVDIHQFLGLPAGTVASGSTDSNTAVVRGIPSIAVGRSRGGDQHTLSEWSDIKSALPATKMVLLLAVSMARLAIVP